MVYVVWKLNIIFYKVTFVIKVKLLYQTKFYWVNGNTYSYSLGLDAMNKLCLSSFDYPLEICSKFVICLEF